MLEIKPALTPDEWARAHSADTPVVETDSGDGFALDPDTGDLLLFDGGSGQIVPLKRRAAVAALAIQHADPSGVSLFTWTDVTRLRSAADFHDLHGMYSAAEGLRQTAARLATLLPPEPHA